MGEATFLTLQQAKQRLSQLQNPEWEERASQILREALKQWRKLHPKATAEAPTGQPKPDVPPSKYKAFPKTTFTGRQQDTQGRQVCFRDGKHAPCEEFGGRGEGWQGVEQEHQGTQLPQEEKALAPLPDQVPTQQSVEQPTIQPPKVPKSPFFNHDHKSLISPYKKKAYTPTAGGTIKPRKPPHGYPSDYNVSKPTPASLAPTHKPAEPTKPLAEQPVDRRLPANQRVLLEKIQQNAGSGHEGTHLAHEIRAHQVDQSVLQQFVALPAKDLTDLAYLLNKRGALTGSNLTEFHDDESPFVILSQPQQMISGSQPTSVVVGDTFASQLNQLEEAFPGVHFLPVEEAPNQLIEAATQLPKPLPRLAGVGQKSNSVVDNMNTKLPRQPSHQTIEQGGKQDKPNEDKAPEEKTSKAPEQPAQQPDKTTPYQVPEQPSNESTETKEVAALPEAIPIPDVDILQTYQSASDYGREIAKAIYTDELWKLPVQQRDAAYRQAYDQAVDQWHETMWQQRGMNKEALPRGEILSSTTTQVGKELSNGVVARKEKIRNQGKNGSWKVTIQTGQQGVLKLGREEDLRITGSSGIRSGTMYRREIAVSSLQNLLGLPQLVPSTTLRVIDNGAPGSIQQYIDTFTEADSFDVGGDLPDAAYGDNQEALAWAAALDYLTGNTDRHRSNWGVDAKGNLVLIDNGMSLPNSEYRLAVMNIMHTSRLLERCVQKDFIVPDLNGWQDKWQRIEAMFSEAGIEPEAIALAKGRWDNLLANSGKSFGGLPIPASGWSTPENNNLKHFFSR